MFIEKQPSLYRISVGKMNYKEHFTGLEDVQSLVQGVDEELSDVLAQVKEEESKSACYGYGFGL